jgi:hypothetical protein
VALALVNVFSLMIRDSAGPAAELVMPFGVVVACCAPIAW